MNVKILFVDDDPNILRSLTRRQNGHFQIETANSGHEGLALLESQGPFTVVVSDMRMPVMDGIQFLEKVKEYSPDTVRMMLTGNADLQTAIDAVNKGSIFRFLTKPCPSQVLVEAIISGVKQYRLVNAERELLEKTLKGTTEVLTEILGMVNPVAFSRASRASKLIKGITHYLEMPNAWEFELAAMLSQLGCITLPPDILEKAQHQKPLSRNEEQMFRDHPSIGHNLLANIPRLELVACMIEGQQRSTKEPNLPVTVTSDENRVELGSQLLKLVLDFDEYLTRGVAPDVAISAIREQIGVYNPDLVTALEKVYQEGDPVDDTRVRVTTVDHLAIGMIAAQDIYTTDELLLVHKGQEVTYPILIRLRNFAKRVGIVEPFRVRVGVEVEEELTPE